MASEREAGWEALQRGDLEEAVRLLTVACGKDPADFEAHMALGAALGRAERHAEAVTSLTSAVHLQPANAQARYNLGVALEKAGAPEEALEAFHQAATLDSSYSKAREAILRLEQRSAAPPLPVAAPGPPDPRWDMPVASPHAVEPPAMPTPMQAADTLAPGGPPADDPSPRMAGPADAGWQPSPAPGPGGPAVSGSPAPAAALPSHGLLSQYAASPHAPAGASAVLDPYSADMPPPNYNDEIDIPQAFRDFGRIIATPDRFFQQQAGRNGLMGPFLIVGVYLVLQFAALLVSNGAQGLIGFAMGLVFSPISLAVAGAWMIFGYLISALFVHFLGWIFGNRQDYSVSFRACVYADAPRFMLSLVASAYIAYFMMPAYMAHPLAPAEIEQAMGLPAGSMSGTYTGSGSSPTFGTSAPAPAKPGKGRVARAPRPATPPTGLTKPVPAIIVDMMSLIWRKFGTLFAVSMGIHIFGWAWSTVLLILAIHRLQRISAGGAIGVVFLMYALAAIVVALIVFGFAGVVYALLSHAGPAAAGGVGR
jgi:tetratricopeptide (TPR) repeat protein